MHGTLSNIVKFRIIACSKGKKSATQIMNLMYFISRTDITKLAEAMAINPLDALATLVFFKNKKFADYNFSLSYKSMVITEIIYNLSL